MFYQTTVRTPPKWPKIAFLAWWPWALTFDLDLQTRPSEGPNTSSLWIWCKSVQRSPRYFIHNKKTQIDGAKKQPSVRWWNNVCIASWGLKMQRRHMHHNSSLNTSHSDLNAGFFQWTNHFVRPNLKLHHIPNSVILIPMIFATSGLILISEQPVPSRFPLLQTWLLLSCITVQRFQVTK